MFHLDKNTTSKNCKTASFYFQQQQQELPPEERLTFTSLSSSNSNRYKRKESSSSSSSSPSSSVMSFPSIHPSDFISRYGSMNHFPQDVIILAHYIATKINTMMLLVDATPHTVSAGILYFAGVKAG